MGFLKSTLIVFLIFSINMCEAARERFNNFSYGMEVGMKYRGISVAEYSIKSVLRGNIDPDDESISINPEIGIDSSYGRYMCGAEQ